MLNIKFVLVAITLFSFVTACSSQSGEETNASTISGDLSFYTSQPDADAEQLIAAFNQEYPDVNVSTFRSGTEEVISKVQAEKQAGDVQADVLLVADAVTFESLKNQNMLLSYTSSEANEIPTSFVDEDGMYTGTKVMSTALVANTEKVADMPTSWDVLTNKSSEGQTIMPSPLYSGAAAYNLGVLTREDNFGWDFYKDIKANDSTVTQGNGAVLKAVAAGEESFGMVVDFIVARAKAEGSPVELIYPQEGVPVITEPIGIMENTDNAPAAKAFVDFVLSEEGQQLAAEIGYTPIRKGVEAPQGLKTVEQMNVLEADVQELFKSRVSDKEQFNQLFGE